MSRRFTIILGGCAAVLAALAAGAAGSQDLSALAGTWYGHAQMPGGLRVEVRMEVGAGSPTWQFTPHTRPSVPNNCLSRPLPLAITPAEGAQFQLHIQASKAVPGCNDGRATLALVDATHLEGKFGDGRPLSSSGADRWAMAGSRRR